LPFAKAITTINTYAREKGTSEEWIDNIVLPGNIVGGARFEEFEKAGGIKKTVEFELREYGVSEDDKESSSGNIST
jgi:hypothetical protein